MTIRVGRFSVRHRWWVLAGWFMIMLAGGLAIGPLHAGLGAGQHPRDTEVGRASDAIKGGLDRGMRYIALVDNIDASADATRAALRQAIDHTRGITGVEQVSDPNPAADGRGVAITVTLVKGDAQHAPYTQSIERMRRLAADLPGATVRFGGGELVSNQANRAVADDLNRAELLSLPLTLVVLVLVFGGVLAAGLPVLAAAGAFLGATGILLALSAVVDLDVSAITVIAVLGLGLSIDYGLLLVARYREELLFTDDRAEALRRAWGTAGRTVMFSALTVAVALSGVLAFDIERLRGIAAAGIVTTLVALLAALTLTAALLDLLGTSVTASRRRRARVEATRALAARPADPGLEAGFFARLARFTQRRPLLVLAGSALALLALAAPMTHLTVKEPQLEALPRSLEAVTVADELSARFGYTTQPAVRVLARTDPATLHAYADRWANDPAVLRVERAAPLTAELSAVVFAVSGDGQGPAARDLVVRLRADRPVGYESWVTGDAAKLIDLNSMLAARLPLAAVITALAMIVLLYLMTGSAIIPLKAIVLNVLSLGATFGVLVAVFQDGWLAGPLDTLTTGGLSPFMIVIVFAFAFALSMDYEVFILARIKESLDAGCDSDTAVRHGLQRSGRIITAAAALMLIIFACFAAARIGQIEQIGLGLLVAVLVDASIVRCLMVPAAMTLLGRAAWWAPAPLKRLQLRHGLRE